MNEKKESVCGIYRGCMCVVTSGQGVQLFADPAHAEGDTFCCGQNARQNIVTEGYQKSRT